MTNLTSKPLYSAYYQAYVSRQQTWFVVAVLKSSEHVVFDRTLDPQTNLFEFFIAPAMEEYFLDLAKILQGRNLIFNLQKLPNRLSDPLQEV